MTKISWTDESWNPVIGCTKIAAGCKNCYAERMACRLAYMGQEKYQRVTGYINEWTHWLGDVFCDDSALDKPLHWRKPRKIFVCSMSDLFHEKVTYKYRMEVFNTIRVANWHTYQILSKRFGRMTSHANYLSNRYPGVFKHVHWYCSVSNQAEMESACWFLGRIPKDYIRGLSVEPLLEPIDFAAAFNDYVPLHHIIIGCESGPKRRLCKLEWIRDVVKQCKEAGVPVFVKQIPINGKCSKKPAEWPEDLRVQEYPK